MKHRTLAAALALCACATAEAQTSPAPRPEVQVDATVFVAAPPEADDPLELAERAIVRGPWSDARRAQALEDNVADPFAAFDSVLGDSFTAANFPATATLLTRVGRAAGYAVNPVKQRYQRLRPFVSDSAISPCIPADDSLRASFTYPSGHGALGFSWALTLAELLPAHTDALIARGIDFGWSRVVCGLHYPSDVESARLVAAAAVARLHADPDFQREFAAARDELARAYGN